MEFKNGSYCKMWCILSSSGLFGDMARCCYVFMALSLNFVRRVRVLNRAPQLLLLAPPNKAIVINMTFLAAKY